MPSAVSDIYQQGMLAEVLASKVLEFVFEHQEPSIPIDPFKIMRKMGIVYQFMDFKDLEGIYLVPEDINDVPVVGINYNRPITRRRFTAAHEICHHLKDRKNEACLISSGRNEIEKYAERFAAALLMPRDSLLEVARAYNTDGKIDLEGAFYLAEQFGVSFRACALRLAYSLHVLPFDDNNELNRRISKFKPDCRKKELGIDLENFKLLKQTVDAYPFYFQIEEKSVWYQFKNNFISNENRMEGVDLDIDEVAEILTDLRLHGNQSEYCSAKYEDIIQVAGHSSIYEYVFSTKDPLTVYRLMNLNKMLFQYAPYPEESGKTRDSNNYVLGANFETTDWKDVATELCDLQPILEDILTQLERYTVSEYIKEVVKIHHRITQIHPFWDGNGRCARAFLNWMLRLKNLPPIYIKDAEKKQYYRALAIADKQHKYKELSRVIIWELFKTIMEVNQK